MPLLDFRGKQFVYAHHLTVPYRPLLSDRRRSLLPAPQAPRVPSPHEPPEVLRKHEGNLIIHGDNLHALKALLPRYERRIKCIYIDPPYNTGNEGWVYNDNVNSELMQEWTKRFTPVDSEDMLRHDKWLCMMWPRLQLLHALLRDDGVIFISIDDNEQHHLRLIMDEIFGEDNFVASFVWWSKYTLSNDAKRVSYQHENVLCYAKSIDDFSVELLPRTEDMDAAYKNPDNDPKGKWKSTPLHAKSGKEEDRYSFAFSNGVTWECPAGRYPSYNKKKLLELYENGELYFGKEGDRQPNKKTYLNEVKQGKTVGSMWSYQEVGSTHSSNEEISSVLGKGVFPNPKGTNLIKRIMQISTNKDDIILDSFAGSGTTAQAVLALNKEDGGQRKFILVECEAYADRITAERVRRVIQGVPAAKDSALRGGLGGEFTYCTLGEPLTPDGLLDGTHLPLYSTLAAYLLHTASGITSGAEELTRLDDHGLFYEGEERMYYLLYEPDLEWLRSNRSMLNASRALGVSAAVRERGKRAVVFAAGKYISQKDLTEMGIVFCQLPYEMYRIEH